MNRTSSTAQVCANIIVIIVDIVVVISCYLVPYGNRGCSGGSRMSSIMYIVDNGGVDRTSSYPYIGRVRPNSDTKLERVPKMSL